MAPLILLQRCGVDSMSRTALDRWEEIGATHADLMEFVDWLERQGIYLDCEKSAFETIDDNKPSNLIDRYLGVDRVALESERRELLEQQRIAILKSKCDTAQRLADVLTDGK